MRKKRQRQAGGVSVSDFLKCKHTIEIRTYKKIKNIFSLSGSFENAFQIAAKKHLRVHRKKEYAQSEAETLIYSFLFVKSIFPLKDICNARGIYESERGVHITNKSIVAVRKVAHSYAVAAKNNRNRINQMQIDDLSSSLGAHTHICFA